MFSNLANILLGSSLGSLHLVNPLINPLIWANPLLNLISGYEIDILLIGQKHHKVEEKVVANILIGSRLTWSPDVCLSVRHWWLTDLTDVTLADENTNSILIDDANNRAILGNMATQVAPPNIRILNHWKWCHLVATFVAICMWHHLVAKFASNSSD